MSTTVEPGSHQPRDCSAAAQAIKKLQEQMRQANRRAKAATANPSQEVTAETTRTLDPPDGTFDERELAHALEAYPQITKVHTACSTIPLPGKDDFLRLVDAIQVHGCLEPALIDAKGRLLDGRSRIVAAYRLGQKIKLQRTKQSPMAIAVSNFARRNLSKSQIAVLAVDLLPAAKEEAKKRQVASLKRGSKQVASETENPTRGKATELIAKQAGVSARLIEKAVQLDPGSRAKVLAGELKVGAAAKAQDLGTDTEATPTKGRRRDSPAKKPASDAVAECGTARKDPSRQGVSAQGFRIAYQSPRLKLIVHRDSCLEAVLLKRPDGLWAVQLPAQNNTDTGYEQGKAAKRAKRLLRDAAAGPGLNRNSRPGAAKT